MTGAPPGGRDTGRIGAADGPGGGNTVAAGVALAEAVAPATRIPADLIGRPDLGRLAPGTAAHLAWLGDDLRARAVGWPVSRCIPWVPCPAGSPADKPAPAFPDLTS